VDTVLLIEALGTPAAAVVVVVVDLNQVVTLHEKAAQVFVVKEIQAQLLPRLADHKAVAFGDQEVVVQAFVAAKQHKPDLVALGVQVQ